MTDPNKSTLSPRQRAEEVLAVTLPLMNDAPPVNLKVICDWLKIEVYTMPCDAFDATFMRGPKGRFLLVNSNLPQGRFRFSIAHELGHLLLQHRPLVHIDEERNPRLERQADAFAADLLVPVRLLRADLAVRPTDDISSLARRYRVSRQTLEIRLKGLGKRNNMPPLSC